jgi:hypothetical protein
MKTIHFFSKIMLLVTCITSGIYADIYLYNNSGWDIKFKFAEPSRVLNERSEVTLKNGDRYNLGDANDLINLSIRRSGLGSSLISSWRPIDIDTLRNKTENFLVSRPPHPSFNQHILWSIISTNTGWDVQVRGFTTPKR